MTRRAAGNDRWKDEEHQAASETAEPDEFQRLYLAKGDTQGCQMNYERLLREMTGKTYGPLPARWKERLGTTIEATLNQREKDILERRLSGETLASIARSYDRSPERLRQISIRAIKKLRRKFIQKGWVKYTRDELDALLQRGRPSLLNIAEKIG